MKPPPTRLQVWLQLLRAPNLFTVPGDPIAGYLLANAGFSDSSLAWVAVASLCFYGAGLLMNDLADLEEDRAERPHRPMPAGHASATQVQRALWLLNAAGLGFLAATGSLQSLAAGAATVAAVWSYNRLTKKIPVLGAVNMGLCRALSVLIGATAGPSPTAALLSLIFAGVIGVYIATVTHLARFETHRIAPLHARFLPILPLLAGGSFGALNALYAPDKFPALILFALPALGALVLLIRMLSNPGAPLPPLIGAHIRLLLPLQAAVCWLGASQDQGPLFAGILTLLWPISRLVSKRFYAS
jgi:4-hydroxybenzoate polyprenyltransferase